MGIYMKISALAAIALFGVVWALVLVPSMIVSDWFQALNPIEQFILYNIGTYFILTGLVGGVISIALTGQINPILMLTNGLIAFLLFSFVFDMWQPPMALDGNGQFIINGTDTLAACSVDYMVGWTWYTIGITGSAIYWLTYIVTPIIAIIVSVFLFGVEKVLNIFGGN